MKFVLLVEGQTEQRSAAPFLKRWLDSRLPSPVGIQTVKFSGSGCFDRGVALKTRMHLEGPSKNDIIAVIGLLDLYGCDKISRGLKTADERYKWGVEYYRNLVKQERFRMYFAVHEFEAWLLSQPEIFPNPIKTSPLFSGKPSPEKVNLDDPPAKRLQREYKKWLNRSYKKTIDGTQLFTKLDPNVAAKQCPHLNDMLNELLSLAEDSDL